MPADPPPDRFPAPAHSTVSSARPTAPLLGGSPGVHPEQYAAAVGLPRRPGSSIGVDERLSSELVRRAGQNRRRVVKLAYSAAAVSGQTTVLFGGGPKAGFQWDVRRLNVGPMDYTAGGFPTGIYVVAVIMSQEEPGAPPSDASRVVTSSAVYPNEATWGRGEVTLLPGEFLRVLITGLGTNVMAMLGGQVEEVAIDSITTYGL